MLELPPLTDREILAARGPYAARDASRPYAWFAETEPSAEGRVEDVAAIFVTNRECPFRCLVCDLWKHTTGQSAPTATVAEQLEWALARLPRTPHVKLYNSGSFFDNRAIARDEWPRIAELVRGRKTLIVESHPRLVDPRCAEFAELIAPVKLQVAMGLETVDPAVLPRLKPNMTLEDFERAARFLVDCGVDVRAFVLLGPPGHRGAESVVWAQRSIEYALAHGVECCAVIPVRSGNGAVEALERRGVYERPTLSQLHAVLTHGLELTARMNRGRVFADLWNVERFYDCARCGEARAAVLRGMNLGQQPAALTACDCSESG
jgi:radical SAM enzyme (TIGR01210 family)